MRRLEHRQAGGSASINRRDAAAVLAEYAAWLAEQPLSTRTREAYLVAVTPALSTWRRRCASARFAPAATLDQRLK